MTPVAVIGLGAMGRRIARRLLDSDHELLVWNRDPAKAASLADQGAILAESPAQAARRAGVVITMVSEDRALREITEGASGVAAGASASTTVIQMSTVGPDAVTRLVAALPAEAALLDAPVLGSLDEAESGRLRIFAGGSPALVQRWTPLLSELGSVVHVGPLGAGTAAKLVANSALFGVLGVLGEGLALARALELSPDVAFDVLAATPLAAQVERRRSSIETGRYPARFSLSLARKDTDLIAEAAAASGTELRLAAATRAWFAEAEESGHGDDDYSAVLARILAGSAG